MTLPSFFYTAALIASLVFLAVVAAGCSHRVAFDTPFGGVEADVTVTPAK